MAAEIQPPYWLWGQVLLLPPVPCCGLHGVETVLPSGSFEQVTHGAHYQLSFVASCLGDQSCSLIGVYF